MHKYQFIIIGAIMLLFLSAAVIGLQIDRDHRCSIGSTVVINSDSLMIISFRSHTGNYVLENGAEIDPRLANKLVVTLENE